MSDSKIRFMGREKACFRSLLCLVLISGLLFPVAVQAYPIDGTFEILDSAGDANGVFWRVQEDASYVSAIISYDKTFGNPSYVVGSVHGSLDGFQLTGNYNLDSDPHTIAIKFNADWSRFEAIVDGYYKFNGKRY
jgi:hypothetical protein